MNGNALNIVKPAGAVALSFFAVSCVCLYVYAKWAGGAARERLAEGGEEVADEDASSGN